MVTTEQIESFLLGEDDEKYIVALEYDYRSDKVYKVIQDPEKGKQIKSDTFTPFAWVGDLRGLNFYQGSKARQKEAMTKNGIMIETLNREKLLPLLTLSRLDRLMLSWVRAVPTWKLLHRTPLLMRKLLPLLRWVCRVL